MVGHVSNNTPLWVWANTTNYILDGHNSLVANTNAYKTSTDSSISSIDDSITTLSATVDTKLDASDLSPSGLAIAGVIGTQNKWRVPYLTSNTSTAVATTPITPPGKTLLATQVVANTNWCIPYLTSNTSSQVGSVRPGGVALLGVNGGAGLWKLPYLISNTTTSAAVADFRPGGLALAGLLAGPDKLPYFTGNTNATTITFGPLGKALVSVIGGGTGQWNVPYFTSNTSSSGMVTPVRSGGLALLSIPGPVSNAVPYFTGNTASSASSSPLSNFIRTLLDDTSQATAQATLGFFAANTIMLFRQSSAPTGWTKLTSKNDCALRVVSGSITDYSAGSSMSTLHQSSSWTVASVTLSQAQMPQHTHTPNLRGNNGNSDGFSSAAGASNSTTVGNAGGNNSHGHTTDMRLNYIDVIIAAKN